MKCPLCMFKSDFKNFKLRNQKEVITTFEGVWEIKSTYKKKSRFCSNCNNEFSVGKSILYKKVKKVQTKTVLTKTNAKDARILLKRKKKFFSIAEIQSILKIPIPILAEKKMEKLVSGNLFKIIEYPYNFKIKHNRKYQFNKEAEGIIYNILDEDTPEISYNNKIIEVNNLLNRLKNSYIKPQSNLILEILKKQRNRKILFDNINNIQIKPSKYYTKYETIIRILFELINIIENEKVLTTKEFTRNINLKPSDLQKVKSNLFGILKKKLIYFNIIASKNQIILEPIPIPLELSEEIAKLEILLRKNIILSLNEYYGSINAAFSNGIPERANLPNIGAFSKKKCEKNLQKQLNNNSKIDKTDKSKSLLNIYKILGIYSLELFEQYMQQLDFNHLIILINYHWHQIFQLKFKNISIKYLTLNLRIIKDARNTNAHRNCKLIEIAKLIESMFNIKDLIKL